MFCRTVQLALCFVLLPAGLAVAQSGDRTEPTPREIENVKIVEHLGDTLPLDAVFTDHTGKPVALGDLITGERPVVLSLIYFNCPQLCSLVLNGMMDSLREVSLKPGEDYDLITVSFDSNETTELAALKRKAYLSQYRIEGADRAWTFLTGDAMNVKRLTEAVGFGFQWVESTKEFAHQAAIYVITPDGRISRYLYGVMFEPKTVRLSLIEAGGGGIGNTLDRFVLTCFRYDPESGTYAASAVALVKWGGGATMAGLAAVIGLFVWMGKRRRAAMVAAEAQP